MNLGGGINLPFKVIGAPWIDAEAFAERMNHQKLPGVHFVAYHYRPLYGAMKGKDCHGVKIVIQDKRIYRPVMVQYMLMGILKSLYPKKFQEAVHFIKKIDKELFCKANGNSYMFDILSEQTYVAWPSSAIKRQIV